MCYGGHILTYIDGLKPGSVAVQELADLAVAADIALTDVDVERRPELELFIIAEVDIAEEVQLWSNSDDEHIGDAESCHLSQAKS
eukprot:COSAG06_NODE_1542_length_9143_cov_6.740380_11_plen_85_part_00